MQRYVLTECLAHTSHKTVEAGRLGSAIAIVLCQTIDWNGGRNKRTESKKQSGDSGTGSDACSNDSADAVIAEPDAETDNC